MMGAGRLRRTAAIIMGGNAKNEKYTGGYGAGHAVIRLVKATIFVQVTELSLQSIRNFL
jgi:hypothetical protein